MVKFQTVLEALQHWSEHKPHSPAVVFRNTLHERHVLTWEDLYTLSGRFAAVLRSDGTDKGTLVINTLPNCPERVVCEAGIWMAGAASVSGRHLHADCSDLLTTVQRSRAPVILLDPDIRHGAWSKLRKHVDVSEKKVVTSTTCPHLRRLLFVERVDNQGPGDFLSGLKAQTDWFQAKDLSTDDLLSVFSTSGSSGCSKLVKYSHRNAFAYLQGSYDKAFVQQPVQFNLTPLAWIGGSLPLSVLPGVTRVALDVRAGIPKDMPIFIWRSIQEEKCNSAMIPPDYLSEVGFLTEIDILKSTGKGTRRPPLPWKLTTLLLTDDPVLHTTVAAGLTLAHKVCVMYGATDAGTVAAKIVTEKGDIMDYHAGKLFREILVKILDPRNEDQELPKGHEGLIVIKRPTFFNSYLNDPEATAASFTKDGFFRTGDLGRLYDRCNLFVNGRASAAIMRGDVFIHPFQIEHRLLGCVGMSGIAFVGIPDAAFHEELCACVTLDPMHVPLERVRRFVEDLVGSGACDSCPAPRYYLYFEFFPLTDTGRPLRVELKTQATRRLAELMDAAEPSPGEATEMIDVMTPLINMVGLQDQLRDLGLM